MENIDIKFIAKKSECSIATVSRVINRSKPVSEKLQKRVVDTISTIIIQAFTRRIWRVKSQDYLVL